MRLPLIALIALLPLATHAEEPWGKVDMNTAHFFDAKGRVVSVK